MTGMSSKQAVIYRLVTLKRKRKYLYSYLYSM